MERKSLYKTVLLIEDDDALRLNIEEQLESNSFVAYSVPCTNDALFILKHYHGDLNGILLGENIPKDFLNDFYYWIEHHYKIPIFISSKSAVHLIDSLENKSNVFIISDLHSHQEMHRALNLVAASQNQYLFKNEPKRVKSTSSVA